MPRFQVRVQTLPALTLCLLQINPQAWLGGRGAPPLGSTLWVSWAEIPVTGDLIHVASESLSSFSSPSSSPS